jgi:hypothetical protein
MEREPTTYERSGIDWWNGLSELDRKFWMMKAGDTGVVADAWAAYQRGLKPMADIEIKAFMTDEEAWALAQLLKRITFDHVRANAMDDDDAYLMLQACGKVRTGLAEAGYSPR